MGWGGVGASQNCLWVILLLLRAFSGLVWASWSEWSRLLRRRPGLHSVLTPVWPAALCRRPPRPPRSQDLLRDHSWVPAPRLCSLSIPCESLWLVRRGPSHQGEALLRREVRRQRSFWCWGWTPGLGCGALRSGLVGVEVPCPGQELRCWRGGKETDVKLEAWK